MAKTPWAERCDRVSFVNSRCRCDRRAEAGGRCAKHSEPMHATCRRWDEPRKEATSSLAIAESHARLRGENTGNY